MLTSYPSPDVPAEATHTWAGIDGASGGSPGMEPLDPLSKQCPDDVPCRVQNPDLWFAEVPAELERAKALCADCPARLACLAGALERHEPWGVWGGEIFERGLIVARKRPRGRPRKVRPDEQAA